MSSRSVPESQIALIYELLRGVLEQPAGAHRQAGSAWQTPFIPPIASEGKLSATDLLSWWFHPASSTTDPWDDFFSQSPHMIAAPATPTAPGHARLIPAWQHRSEEDLIPQFAEELSPWTDLSALIAEPDDQLADEHALAVVECLYDFIHAIGRRDVDAAMALVSEEYHVLEDDHEIDQLGLRHQIESLLDSLRGWELDVSLVEIPRPYLHPYGILIYTEIQIDAYHREHDLQRSFVQRRFAVFERYDEQKWLISALSPV